MTLSAFIVTERGDLCRLLGERERELYKAVYNYCGKYLLLNAITTDDNGAQVFCYRVNQEEVE